MNTKDTLKVPRLAAMVLTREGHLLPYTCQNTVSQVEEWCEKNFASWNKHKELGAKIVPVTIVLA